MNYADEILRNFIQMLVLQMQQQKHNLDSICQFKNCYSLVKFSENVSSKDCKSKILSKQIPDEKKLKVVDFCKKVKKFICIKLLLHAIITDFSNENEQAGETAFD
ncbi:hypothetical protein D917_04841 [Trichinella nativa]|uniref:Uncharacterized protein n=1 Tax=Trichinella nativa TaxID=6335 RepID=A0A1Y3EXX0_9BILA|nr:hypothetical protein D917_04841 [Trichinella nativa]